MPFTPGQIVLRRYFRGAHYTFAKPMRVVSDDAAGLLLWMPVDSEFAVLTDVDGRPNTTGRWTRCAGRASPARSGASTTSWC